MEFELTRCRPCADGASAFTLLTNLCAHPIARIAKIRRAAVTLGIPCKHYMLILSSPQGLVASIKSSV